MANVAGKDTGAASQAVRFETIVGEGGELHQVAGADGEVLTTQQGIPVADDQNHLKVGVADQRCSRISTFAKRSSISITSAFPSVSFMPAASGRTAISS